MPIPLTSDTQLSHHREGYLIATCKACGHRHDFKVNELAPRIGWDTKISRIIRRFRCEPCGARRVSIEFGYDMRPRRWTKNPS